MNCSSVFPNHHRLHLSHLYNNNNKNISNAAFQIKWDEHNTFKLRLVKILVSLHQLLMLLWLLLPRLLVPRRMTIMRAIMRMRLIKIQTTCNHEHQHRVVHMKIIAMVGLHHHLRYEIMTIFLN